MPEFSWQFLWLALIVIFFIAEALTVSLATIWFAIGAIIALIASWFGLHYGVQIAVFVISSMALLAFTRPIAKKYIVPKQVKTNAESLIGKDGIVTEDIAEYTYGQVRVHGQVWTAKGESAAIPAGSEIVVTAIEGVKLIVKAK